MLALQGAHESLEAHTGIDDVHWQGFERTVGLAVELHEHDVPDLNHLWVVLVYEFASRCLCLLLRSAGVEMNLRAWTARACVAHLPEVVVLVAIDDMVGRHMLEPEAGCLIVASESLLGRALEYCDVEVVRIEMKHVDEVFPCVVDGALLEVVAEAPVAEHLKHGVVVGIVAHFLEVVVLTAHAQTLLCVGTTAWLRLAGAEDNVFPLVHTCIGEHQRRVVFDDHWR